MTWMLAMRWEKLLFLHWPLPPAVLSSLLPPGVDLETFDGDAWLGIVPFMMRDVHPRFLPSVPGSTFPELNVRTYVSVNGVPGVWFFSLEAASPVAVRLAQAGFHLPYFNAQMQVKVDGGEVRFQSRRTHPRAAPASFKGRYRPRAGVLVATDLTRFLTERYSLYSANAKGRLYRADLSHAPWPLQRAEVELIVSPSAMTRQLGLHLPATPPLVHYTEQLNVRAGLPYRVRT